MFVVDVLLGVVILLLIALIVLVYAQYRKPLPGNGGELSAVLQNLNQTVNANQVQTSVLTEKIAHLEPLAQVVNGVQLELRSLAERVSAVDQNQNAVGQRLQAVAATLAETGATAASLIEATAAIRSEVVRAKESLTELHTHARARQELEQRTAESIRRLEAVIAGTQSKGIAGENILEVVFAKLPADWQVRNFRVGNKFVEFGLRLPNGLILPIDSKWAATGLVEQFAGCEDPAEQQKLKAQIESAVLNKAREIKKYIDPGLTLNFGVVAVPDAVYELCYGIQTAVFELKVVLIGYSMFIPYLLLVFQVVLKASQNIDLEKVNASLQSIEENVNWLQEEIEGRFSRSITMLENSRKEAGAHLSKIRSALLNIQVNASVPEQPEKPAIES
ncbi:MAG: DNA recombination protein RmuC [Bacillota bacterium]